MYQLSTKLRGHNLYLIRCSRWLLIHGVRSVSISAAGRPPNLSSQGIEWLLKEKFPFKHIDVESVKSLPSYDDRNYYFRGVLELPQLAQVNAEGMVYASPAMPCSHSTESAWLECIVKITNPFYVNFEEVKGLNFIMRHLRSQGFKCIPHTQLTRTVGSDLCVMEGKNLLKYCDLQSTDHEMTMGFSVRVLSFIPGEMFDETDKKYITTNLLLEIGKYFGQISTELKKLSVPAIEARNTTWNLLNFVDVSQHVGELEDLKQREIATKVIGNFKEHVVPKIPSFKKGIIHGDANGLNIVVKKKSESDEYELAGIIDFGDCVRSCYVFDLGILLAYVMMENLEPIGGESPIEFVAPLLRGYHQMFPFSREEISSLYYIVMARCCQSAVLGTISFKKEPWNTYLLISREKCWKLLQLMLVTPKEEVDNMWIEEI